MIRNLLRAVDFFPFAYLSGLVAMLVHPDFKRLGDLAAGTVVVHEERHVRRTHRRGADAIAPKVALTLAEQEAIGDFADRSENWSKGRLIELADLAEAVTGARGEDGVQRLLGIASWLAEER